MDPRDFIVVLDTWLKNMESNVHQIRAAVKTLCDHAIFDASTKMVLPDALNINESLRYSNVFREYIGGMRKDDRNTSTTGAGDLFLHNSTRGLCQLIYEMEMSIQRRSKQGPVTDRNDNGPSGGPKDLLGQALKKARADQTPTADGGDAEDGKDVAVEATTKKRPAKPAKPAKPAPKKRKISVENLPKVLRTKKRASVKAARRSSIPARGSFITIRRSSIVKRKSSIARKSNAGDAPPNPKPFACLVYGCSYAGARKAYLGTHMKKHAKDKLVDCKMCDKKFKTGDAIQLAKHVAEHKSK